MTCLANRKTTRALRLAAALAACGTAATLGAQGPVEPVGETVATALASAQNASERADREGLAKALGIIKRSGARPLKDWSGQDPVPQWRELVREEGPALRGSPLGPGYRSGKILGGKSDSFEQVFLSGQKASIVLSTPGKSPLSLAVLDGSRKPVCETGNARNACHWVPLFTQRYVIEVRNRGESVADYFLVVD